MTSILKVDQLQDSGGNAILTSDGAGSITTASGLNTAITNAGFATTNGITMADQWRLTANTNSGVNAYITTNWERADDPNWSGIGTGLTESSGLFSFAQTGLYLISGNFVIYVEAGDAAAGVGVETTNNNSSFSTDAIGYAGNEGSVAAYGMASFQQFFNVEDVTNYKFKFVSSSFSGTTVIIGNTTYSVSGFIVTRLGDSV